MAEPPEGTDAEDVGSQEGFGELLKNTAVGYFGGLLLGLLLDTLGLTVTILGVSGLVEVVNETGISATDNRPLTIITRTADVALKK